MCKGVRVCVCLTACVSACVCACVSRARRGVFNGYDGCGRYVCLYNDRQTDGHTDR